jgi:hypothetical protein
MSSYNKLHRGCCGRTLIINSISDKAKTTQFGYKLCRRASAPSCMRTPYRISALTPKYLDDGF